MIQRLLSVPLLVALVAGLAIAGPGTAEAQAGNTYYVAPGGEDTPRRTTEPQCPGDRGTLDRPWRTVNHGLRCLYPGDTLIIRGGTYDMPRDQQPVIRQGRVDAPIRVQAYPGERVVIRGFLRLEVPDNWHIDRINITSLPGFVYGSGEYLLKVRGGTNWSFTNGEVWNARSYSAVRVESTANGQGPRNWRLSGNCIHDTAKTHGVGEDHNIYVDTGPNSSGGVIERNVVYNAPNGTNLKVGPGSDPRSYTRDVTVRFNTFWNARQNVLANGQTRDIDLHRNLIGGTIVPSDKTWYPNVRGFALTGGNNVARFNYGHGTSRFIFNDQQSNPGWRDGGGNVHPGNPRLNNVSSCAGFAPGDSNARRFGHAAAMSTPRSLNHACPVGRVPSADFRDVPGDHLNKRAIDCVVWWKIAGGYSDGTYKPAANVNRAQMATFIAQMILEAGGTLPAAGNRFNDISGNPHAENIERLAAAGIVRGTGPGKYSPGGAVTRAQMASFLAGAHEHRTNQQLSAPADYFTDDDGGPHEPNINRLAHVGVTGGPTNGGYGPGVAVKRDQMARFIVEMADLLVEQRHASTP